MSCTCGEEAWRPHGSYRTADGEKRKRLKCEGCGGTVAAHLVERSSDRGDRDDTAVFWRRLVRGFTEHGFTEAKRYAREAANFSAATASRRLDEFPLEELLAGGEWSSTRIRFLRDVVELYRQGHRGRSSSPEASVPAPPPELEVVAEAEQFWEALARARAHAAVIYGHRFGEGSPRYPSWIDRLAPEVSSARELCFPSRWQVALAELDSLPGRVTSLMAAEDGRRGASSLDVERWAETRGSRLRNLFLDRWRQSEAGRTGRCPAPHDVRRSFAQDPPPVSDLDRFVFRTWKEIRRLWRDTDYVRLAREDLGIDRNLTYWLRHDESEFHVEIATRRRVVGKASFEMDANPDEFALKMQVRELTEDLDDYKVRIPLVPDGLLSVAPLHPYNMPLSPQSLGEEPEKGPN